jgi:hypothetical protein
MPSNKECQPPRNRIVVMNETRIMFAYSARKKIANAEPAYSTWNPATISLSPSATSNGARFVSASPEIRKITNIGNRGTANQCAIVPPCAATIALRLSEPASSSTPTTDNPIASS